MGRKGDVYWYIVTGSTGVVSCTGHVTVPERVSCHILPCSANGATQGQRAVCGNVRATCGMRQCKGNVRRLSYSARFLPYSASVELYGAGGIRWKGVVVRGVTGWSRDT